MLSSPSFEQCCREVAGILVGSRAESEGCLVRWVYPKFLRQVGPTLGSLREGGVFRALGGWNGGSESRPFLRISIFAVGDEGGCVLVWSALAVF